MLDSVDRKLHIDIEKVVKPYRKPNVLAEYISLQLEKRVPFRKAMKKAIELAEWEEVEGIQIQIAGRLDEKEIAWVEWDKGGRVPLQTIWARIDYCYYPVQTIYGVSRIKILILEE
jgi:small subunit ribosomal protein S3